jgi:hypothetical protein
MLSAIESLLGSIPDETDELEKFVMNFSSRINFLEVTGMPAARQSASENDFLSILGRIRKSNAFRNQILHNSFTGIVNTFDNDRGLYKVGFLKKIYHPKLEKRSYTIYALDIRESTFENFRICDSLQGWVLTVRPNADLRVP